MVVPTKPSKRTITMLNTSDKIITHKTGLLKLAEELGIFVSPSGVRSIWLWHDLANFRARLTCRCCES